MEENNEETGTELAEDEEIAAAQVTSMFKKILALGNQSGEIVMNAGGGDEMSSPQSALVAGPSASQPTIYHNGRMVRMRYWTHDYHEKNSKLIFLYFVFLVLFYRFVTCPITQSMLVLLLSSPS